MEHSSVRTACPEQSEGFKRFNVQTSLTAIREFADTRTRWARHGTGAISVVLFIVAWHLVAASLASPYIPQPYAVARALVGAFLEKDFLGFTIGRHIV